MSTVGAWLRGLRYDLPRGVYVLQAGLVINAFGNGAANPFVLLYLHNVRGIPLAVAGLVPATGAACALVYALLLERRLPDDARRTLQRPPAAVGEVR